jgi:hypothetical protein
LHVGAHVEPGESAAVQLPTSPSVGWADASHVFDAHIAGDVEQHAPVSEHATQHSPVCSNTDRISASSQQ